MSKISANKGGSATGQRVDKKQTNTLENITFAFVDVETTGLSPEYGDRVCEVAVLKVKNNCQIDLFHTLVNCERKISPGAFAVNGITQNMLKGKPKFSEIAPQILRLLNGCVVVCHNAVFDMSFLAAELERCSLSFPNYTVVDTLMLSRRCFKFFSNALQNVAMCLNIEVQEEHRALSDVLTTWKVFQRFVENFSWRGISTVEQLISLQSEPTRRRWNKDYALPPQLEEAVKNKKTLRLKYVSREGKTTERTIEPLEITRYSDYFYLVGYCRLRNAERMFRLDRVIELNPVEQTGK
ncbi:MAG: exonuclease domain-containing protein [Elusimicrobiota bacterium]